MTGARPLALALGLAACATPRVSARMVAQLEGEVLAARTRMETLQAEARRCEAATGPSRVYLELTQVLAGTEVELVQDAGVVAAIIPSDLLFGRDGLSLRDEAMMVLDLLATALLLHPEVVVQVVAHSDDQPLDSRRAGLAPDLQAFSTLQARAVSAALSDRFGVPPARLSPLGRGALSPREVGDTSAEKARNRRVVIEILPPRPWG